MRRSMMDPSGSQTFNGSSKDGGAAAKPKRQARPQTAPASDGAGLRGNTFSMTRVQHILNEYGTLKKIKTIQERRYLRDCEGFKRDVAKVDEALVELIQALDFKFFEKLTEPMLYELVSHMTVSRYGQSEYCFRKGAVGNHFFCIFSGEVDIILQEGARPIATLGPGQSFGEMALLNDAPRAASVRCRTAVICGQIHRSDFQRMISQQKAMADAKAYSTVNFTVPFNEMEIRFKRHMVQCMEQRRILKDREVLEGSNLVNDLVISGNGKFEICADIRMFLPEDQPRLVTDANGVSRVIEGRKVEKIFRNVPVGKIDRKGVAYGLGAIIEGHDAPGIRDWIPDVEFLGVRMFTRELPESIVYTIPKKKFHALLREDTRLRRWCMRLHNLYYRMEQTLLHEIVNILNRSDFVSKETHYIQKIHEAIDWHKQKFFESVEWRYYLEDVRESAKDKSGTFSLEEEEVVDENRRDKTWDYI